MGITAKPMGVLKSLIVADEVRKAKEAQAEKKAHRKGNGKKADK